MKKKSLLKSVILLLFMLVFTLFSHGVQAADTSFPKPVGAINDFAGVIPQKYKSAMENLSREVLAKTGTALVVAVLPDIGNDDVNDYANRLYQAWGIGKKGEDRGVLILLALKERRVRIETGYGVEGILPDGLTGQILDTYALPNFRAGDYGKGLYQTLSAVSAVVAKNAGVTIDGSGGYSLPSRTDKKEKNQGFLQYLLLGVALLFLLGTRQGRAILPWILLLLMQGGEGGRRGGGGGFGGGFGGFGGGISGGGGSSRDF